MSKRVSTRFLFVSSLLLSLVVSCGKNEKSNEAVSDLNTSQIIIGSVDWDEVSLLSEDDPKRQASLSVASLDLPVMGSRCTGFMISPDVLMTNQHCIPSSRYAAGVTAVFNHVQGVDRSQHVRYDCSEFIGNDSRLDFALLRCAGSPGSVHGFLELDAALADEGDDIYVVHQNCDYYSVRNCDWTKKVSEGSIVEVSDEYAHDADTLGGSSGSPMLSAGSNKVVGIHHAGLGNNGWGRGIENYAVPMSKIVPVLRSRFASVLSSGGSGSGSGSSGGGSSVDSDNDSFSSADELDLSRGDVEVDEEIDSSSDVDYFKVKLTRTSTLKVKISFSHRRGDLDLKLYSSSKRTIKTSAGVKNSEEILKTLSAGTYYIKVYGYRGSQGDYELSVEK
jgi:hypothetical protein